MKKIGDKIDLVIYRNGDTQNLSTTLSEFTE